MPSEENHTLHNNVRRLDVLYIFRAPSIGYYSIERVFNAMIARLPATVSAGSFCVPRAGVSVSAISRNILAVWRLKSQVIHITGDVHYVAIIPRKRTIVLTIHDCVSLRRTRGIRHVLLRYLWYYLPIRLASAVTTISDFSRSELLSYIGSIAERIRVVHDPLLPGFSYRPRAFNRERPVILHFAHHKHKNLSRTILALREIPCHLRVIGRIDEQELSLLRECKISYSAVADLSDEEVTHEFIACDILCFPSLYEGFGMPIIEAQAIGRPVLTSDLCSLPEVAGGAACLVDPFNPDDIARGLLKIIEDDGYRAGLIQSGLENVKRFHPDVIARKYADIYREVVTG